METIYSSEFLCCRNCFFITLLLSENPVVIASIGQQQLFLLSNNIALNQRIIGGHFLIFSLVHVLLFSLHAYMLFKAMWFALSIGFTILLMVVEHPPAAGTSLGMTLLAIVIVLLLQLLLVFFY